MENILTTHRLTKYYGRIKAIDSLTIAVGSGQIFGLLGPNGSGKTTTLAIIMGTVKPQSGSCTWFEGSFGGPEMKRITGSLIETPNFYPYLNLVDNLKIVAAIKELHYDDIDRVLRITGLHQRKYSTYNTLSLGMKQRLAFSSVLLGDPQVLVLDEPTNGLDPEGIAEVRNIILEEAGKGKTIILASHILAEVEKVCSHVAILKAGELIATGRVDELLGGDPVFRISSTDTKGLEEHLIRAGMVKTSDRKGDELLITCTGSVTAADLNKFAFEHGFVLSELMAVKKSLESQFLELVK